MKACFFWILKSIKITYIYSKDTHASQYINYHRQTPWKLKTSWIKALYHRFHRIRSDKQVLNKQISQIKKFMSWNVYPKRVRNPAIKRLEANKSHPRLTNDDDRMKVWLSLPYNGKLGEGSNIFNKETKTF